jgi:hypothetical protein
MNEVNIEAEANETFYKWEEKLFNGNSPLSDDDRNLFVTGYVMAVLKTKGELA